MGIQNRFHGLSAEEETGNDMEPESLPMGSTIPAKAGKKNRKTGRSSNSEKVKAGPNRPVP